MVSSHISWQLHLAQFSTMTNGCELNGHGSKAAGQLLDRLRLDDGVIFADSS